MKNEKHSGWFHKPENCWLLVAVILGFLNLAGLLLIWNATGANKDMESLAISITVLEILLSVIAVTGFFVIRSAAISKAEEEAAQVAEKVTRKELPDLVRPMVNRAIVDYLSLLEENSGTISSMGSIVDLMQALDNGGADDER